MHIQQLERPWGILYQLRDIFLILLILGRRELAPTEVLIMRTLSVTPALCSSRVSPTQRREGMLEQFLLEKYMGYRLQTLSKTG